MDRDVVERARNGDRVAFAEVASALVDQLYAVAARILRDSDAAGDAVQMTLVQIWRDLPSLRDVDRIEAWAQRVLVHRCFAQLRAARRRAPTVGLLDTDAAVDDVQMPVSMRDELERAFARLTPDQRAVLVLTYFRDQSVQQTAAGLGVSVGTVKSRLFGARRALRAAIEADERPVAQESRT